MIDRGTHVRIQELACVVTIATVLSHYLAVLADGTVRVWGVERERPGRATALRQRV